jgi:hypothetical protein
VQIAPDALALVLLGLNHGGQQLLLVFGLGFAQAQLLLEQALLVRDYEQYQRAPHQQQQPNADN